MVGLLYREMILNKKNLIFITAGEFLISLMLILPIIYENSLEDADLLTQLLSVFVFLMLFLVLGMLTAGIFENDENKRWAYYITSTPLTDAGHIKEKYMFTLLLYIVLFTWCYFLSALSAALGSPANVLPAFEMMCMMILANALEFPFLVRFGSRAGNYVKTAAGLVLLLIAIEFVLFGNVSMFKNPETIFALIKKLSDTSAMSNVALIVLASLPYLSAGLYFLSYRISCKLYLKGAEEYDR